MKQTNLEERLRACGFDRDNFPNMGSERANLTVKEALDAATEIERLRSLNAELVAALELLFAHSEATILSGWQDHIIFESARAALAKVKEGK